MSYIRDVKYYETDKMGIVHHSNYVRWFEEARMDFLDKIGFPYDKFEEMHIMSPVLAVSCVYKKSVTFGEKVKIETKVSSFNGVKLCLSYTVWNMETDEVTTTGQSEHCFVDEQFRPLNMKKWNKEFYDRIIALI